MLNDQLPYGTLLLTRPTYTSLTQAASIVRKHAINTLDSESISLVRILRSADTEEQQAAALTRLRSWVYNLLDKDETGAKNS